MISFEEHPFAARWNSTTKAQRQVFWFAHNRQEMPTKECIKHLESVGGTVIADDDDFVTIEFTDGSVMCAPYDFYSFATATCKSLWGIAA